MNRTDDNDMVSSGGTVKVSVTRDASVSGHKSDEKLLYLMSDTKDPDGPKLAFTQAEWDAFVAGVKNGEFDISQ